MRRAQGLGRERDRRDAGRRADALLRAAVRRRRCPSGHVERVAAQRGDRVHNGQRAVLAGDRRDLLDRVEHAGRGLGVHHRHHVGALRRSARRTASGSTARPHSYSRRVTCAAVALGSCRRCGRRSTRRPATARACRRRPGSRPPVSIAEVPVPDTAKANEPSGARKAAARRPRNSSIIAIRSGSRWLSTGRCHRPHHARRDHAGAGAKEEAFTLGKCNHDVRKKNTPKPNSSIQPPDDVARFGLRRAQRPRTSPPT